MNAPQLFVLSIALVFSAVPAARGQSPSTSVELFKMGSADFVKGDYRHAADRFQRALDLEKQKVSLPRNSWRVLVDYLAMSYGIPGDSKRAREVLAYGISQDPEYPNFHCTLACAYAESDDLDHTLEELGNAFKYKANRIPGEPMPDPRSDAPFRKLRSDGRFQRLMTSLYPGQLTLYWPAGAVSSQSPAGVEKNPHVQNAEPGQIVPEPSAQSKSVGKRICFVALGDFPVADVEELAGYYRQAYGLRVDILPGIGFPEGAFDNDRQQLVAERLLAGMRQAFQAVAHDRNAILIGFVAADMYILGENWRFAFGLRDESGRAAVVSSARMDLHYRGEPSDQAHPDVQLRKMVTKDIGILYYHLPQKSDPRSVLYDKIMGIQELDQVGEEY